MKKLINITLIFILCTALGCMSVRYVVEQEPDSPLNNYQTYAVEEHCFDVPIGINDINQIRVRTAIEQELRKRGLKSDKAKPEMMVKYFVKNKTIYYNSGCDDYYDEMTGGRQCIERIDKYEEGTLILDIIDVADQKVIWHGAAIGPTYDDLKNPQKKINMIIKELLEEIRFSKQS